MDEHTISPAGDPFYAASPRTDETIEAHYASLERGVPCSCYGGYHYISHMIEDEHGEEVEVFEAVPAAAALKASKPRLKAVSPMPRTRAPPPGTGGNQDHDRDQ